MRYIFIGVFLLIGVLTYGQNSPISKYLKEEWKTVNVGNGLSISSPFEMEETDLSANLSEGVKKMIEKMGTYTIASKYKLDDLFTLYVASVTYVPTVAVNLQGALSGAKGNLENIGAENLVCNSEDANEFELKGTKMICSFSRNQVSFNSETFVYVKENKMWLIIILYRESDKKDGEEFVKKVHDSIKFVSQ